MSTRARAAATTVAAYAVDAADARLLLDMLGLVDEHGQLVDVLEADDGGHGREGHDVVLHELVPTSTVPAGLRADAAPAVLSVSRPRQRQLKEVVVDVPPLDPVYVDWSPPTEEPAPAGITVDVGEVVHPEQPADQAGPAEVDEQASAAADVVHLRPGRDLLAVGLTHRDPAVRAAAERARRAVDQLASLLAHTPTRGASR